MGRLSCEMMGLPTDICGVYCAIRGCTLSPNQKPSPEAMKKRQRPSFVNDVLSHLPPAERPKTNDDSEKST